MNSSDSNDAFKLFSANRSQGGFTMINWDPLFVNQLACNLAFSQLVVITTSRMCAVEEENRYQMCAQEPCLNFLHAQL